MHCRPPTSTKWNLNRVTHPTRPPIQSSTQSCNQALPYALDIDKAIDRVTQACHQCAALHQSPKMREEQSSTPSPDAVGVSFAADIIKRSRQLVLVLREYMTCFTATTLLEDEQHNTLRDVLIRLCVQMRPLDGPSAIIRNDPASGFNALTEDLLLKHHRITIEIGNA